MEPVCVFLVTVGVPISQSTFSAIHWEHEVSLKGGIGAFYAGQGCEGLYFCLVGEGQDVCCKFDCKNLSGEVGFLAKSSVVRRRCNSFYEYVTWRSVAEKETERKHYLRVSLSLPRGAIIN